MERNSVKPGNTILVDLDDHRRATSRTFANHPGQPVDEVSPSVPASAGASVDGLATAIHAASSYENLFGIDFIPPPVTESTNKPTWLASLEGLTATFGGGCAAESHASANSALGGL